jgi:hypothetical protein
MGGFDDGVIYTLGLESLDYEIESSISSIKGQLG